MIVFLWKGNIKLNEERKKIINELIDLSSFNTTKVTDMSFMLNNCSSLKSIDLSSFNTTNVTDMYDMFYGCSSLKKENIKVNKNGKKILEYI